MSGHVFICYAREDEEFALQLARILKASAIPVWVDQWDIQPGANWVKSIDRALEECSTCLVVL
jgi:TIR domain